MINYKILHEAQEYYEGEGFQFVETTWTVPHEIMMITYYIEKPDNPFYLKHKDKTLVASGEQSFLAMYNKGFLPKGKFQTITPCFRDETFDETHTKYFMKNELIITDIQDSEEQLKQIVECAQKFFQRFVPEKEDVRIVKCGDLAYDLYYQGVEIGSYGYRECSFLKWIFGTGVAEPRFSRVIGD